MKDHTSKAFQPKYTDCCIIGLLGKNQIEIKDNHGHTTKVHRRDIKKIPMTEKVCQLYEEEQIGKVREERKVVPNSKMPHLGWDTVTKRLQTTRSPGKFNKLHPTQYTPPKSYDHNNRHYSSHTRVYSSIPPRNSGNNEKSSTSSNSCNHKNQL